MFFLFGAIALAAPRLALERSDYRLTSGATIALEAPASSLAQLRVAVPRVRISGPSDHGIVLLPREDGRFALAASLTAPPGEYRVEIAAGEQFAEIRLTLDPARPVPQNATRPPVILLNGYQLASIAQLGVCTAAVNLPHSSGTFGELEAALLRSGTPIVYFFDNCVEAPKARIEELGNALGRTIAEIRFADGTPVPQVDLVAHSMGGLIVRSYLAGLQTNGTYQPPANPKVRKYVQISTPNFGSAFAAALAQLPFVRPLLDDQVKAMLPASDFLFGLATQTGWGDDLRGVDALSVVANGGKQPQLNASDGVVSLPSASLAFARGTERVRILPYCHTESDFIDCTALGIAKAPETAAIVSSFLAGTNEWRSSALSKVPEDDAYLSQSGSVFVSAENAQGQPVASVASALFGALPLTLNLAGTAAYGEFLKGSALLTLALPTGTASCGTVVPEIGTTTLVRCRPAPSIQSVEPSLAGPLGRVVPTGSRVTINGTGFGTRCSTCSVAAVTPLEIISWNDTAIVATLPAAASGLAEVIVQASTGAGRFRIRIGAAPFGVSAVINGASFQAGFAPGGWVTIKGAGLARTTRTWQSSDFLNGRLPTTLDGVSVKINGLAAPVYYISPTQMNVLAPTGDRDAVLSRTVDIEVTSPEGTTRTLARRQRQAPAVFVVNGYAAALTVDGTLIGPARPARPGDVLALYVTGLGAVVGYDTALVSQVPLALPEQVFVTVGDRSAQVTFAGVVGPGLYQVNFAVPSGVSGDAPVTIQIGDIRSPNTEGSRIVVAQ